MKSIRKENLVMDTFITHINNKMKHTKLMTSKLKKR